MTQYVLIESQDLFEGQATKSNLDLCQNLARSGSGVEVFFVQNGVLGLRGNQFASVLSEMARAGVKFSADLASLQMRGIHGNEIPAFIKPCNVDSVIDSMAAGKKIIWH